MAQHHYRLCVDGKQTAQATSANDIAIRARAALVAAFGPHDLPTHEQLVARVQPTGATVLAAIRARIVVIHERCSG